MCELITSMKIELLDTYFAKRQSMQCLCIIGDNFVQIPSFDTLAVILAFIFPPFRFTSLVEKNETLGYARLDSIAKRALTQWLAMQLCSQTTQVQFLELIGDAFGFAPPPPTICKILRMRLGSENLSNFKRLAQGGGSV